MTAPVPLPRRPYGPRGAFPTSGDTDPMFDAIRQRLLAPVQVPVAPEPEPELPALPSRELSGFQRTAAPIAQAILSQRENPDDSGLVRFLRGAAGGVASSVDAAQRAKDAEYATALELRQQMLGQREATRRARLDDAKLDLERRRVVALENPRPAGERSPSLFEQIISATPEQREIYKSTTRQPPAPPSPTVQFAPVDQALQISKQYGTDAKDFFEVRKGFEKVQQAATQDTQAGDMSLIFGIMKMQDPGSTVREGEYATAQNTPGLSERVRGLYNQTVNNKRLTPQQRGEFLQAARGIVKSQRPLAKQLRDRYGRIVGSSFNLDDVAPDPFAGVVVDDAPQKPRNPFRP